MRIVRRKAIDYISKRLFNIILFVISLLALIKRVRFFGTMYSFEQNTSLAVALFFTAIAPFLWAHYTKQIRQKVGFFCLGIYLLLLGLMYIISQRHLFFINYGCIVFLSIASIAFFIALFEKVKGVRF